MVVLANNIIYWSFVAKVGSSRCIARGHKRAVLGMKKIGLVQVVLCRGKQTRTNTHLCKSGLRYQTPLYHPLCSLPTAYLDTLNLDLPSLSGLNLESIDIPDKLINLGLIIGTPNEILFNKDGSVNGVLLFSRHENSHTLKPNMYRGSAKANREFADAVLDIIEGNNNNYFDFESPGRKK